MTSTSGSTTSSPVPAAPTAAPPTVPLSAPEPETPSPSFPAETRSERTKRLVGRATRMEAAGWVSLARLVFFRPRVPAGAVAVPYHRPIVGILTIFIVLSALEVPIIDLIVHPWPFVRVPLLILGIWGVVFMLGMLAGYLTRPHAVGPEGIRVRQSTDLEVVLGWDDVLSVARRREIRHKGPKFTPGRVEDAWVLHLPMQDETNLVVELERPIEVAMPRGVVRIDEIRFWADDPTRFMDAARPHLEAATPSTAT
ncbi:hypothetical protein [Microbacterium invictum]|uniref:PH domain-containing protein n=1 Tax=Microbacterium invictum TaxID=515415 RepID=A0ABZ0VDH9_9MICO|nr:hypothetical protein [Microbacterium invictum]WQB69862.1 hypothetical protein T9R20_14350 [Microbacterium invictum]